MSHFAIEARGLSKSYRLGGGVAFGRTFREMIYANMGRVLRRSQAKCDSADDVFWALRDLDFSISEGEVVGIIGHNGAGKSTLLKLLSSITDPTEGKAVIRGRVASLLEVGTGFHPELSGRENIYLNGSILGMTRAEISKHFDEIVDFSGIESFLETPVKRYSSGMTVRLAFAVAAHLEPEILMVDEVLAVGDIVFQKKCLGKMQDVVKNQGRTVLFVSHNMDSIRALCNRVMVMDHGTTQGCQSTDEGVQFYYDLVAEESSMSLLDRSRLQSNGHAPVFADIQLNDGGSASCTVPCGSPLRMSIELANMSDVTRGECGVVIRNEHGQRIALFQSQYHADMVFKNIGDTSRVEIVIPSMPLAPGRYHIDLAMYDQPEVVDYVERVASFDVVFADLFGTGKIPCSKQGHVVLPSEWKLAA
jgi:lipopolysaccharide transport system ATP-binding protein